MANKKILEVKQDVVKEIVDKAKNSASFVVFEYQGLTVGETSVLRKMLRESESELKVYKNTLTTIALKELNIDLGEMSGPKAIVFGKDEIAPVKVLSEFAKKYPKAVLKCGYVSGNVADEVALKKYASIPSRQGLLTMIAVGLLEPAKKFAICVDLHRKNLENN